MRFISLLVLVLSLGLPLGAEEAQRVLRIHPFEGDALSPGEATALQNLITSYVVELRAFRVIDTSGQELALREAETAVQLGVPKDLAPLAADYVLSGNASLAGGVIIFSLEVTKVSTGEKQSVSETASTVNELILASRRLVRSLFEQPNAPPVAAPVAESGPALGPPESGVGGGDSSLAPASPQPPATGAEPGTASGNRSYVSALDLALVAGAWKGDKGVERVSLFADGRGIAILSSGASMRIRASIEGATLVVYQDQESIPDYYRGPGLNFGAAKQVAAQARPWKWVFSLVSSGDSLIGVKESVFVKVDSSGTVSVDNNYVRDAEWTRLFR